MIGSAIERIQASPFGPAGRTTVSTLQTPWWLLRGRPVPAPPHRKRSILAEHVRDVRPTTFVETGTFRGDTVARIGPMVPRLVSIELDDVLYERARNRFRSRPNVEILHGDSAELLPEVVRTLHGSAVFWLDGHYSGGPTALGTDTTPIFSELQAILTSEQSHVALVDDVRLFNGTDGYPALDDVLEFVRGLSPEVSWTIASDILRFDVRLGRT